MKETYLDAFIKQFEKINNTGLYVEYCINTLRTGSFPIPQFLFEIMVTKFYNAFVDKVFVIYMGDIDSSTESILTFKEICGRKETMIFELKLSLKKPSEYDPEETTD